MILTSTVEERLADTVIQHGSEGKIKECVSISGAKVDGRNIIYLGVHGSIVKIVLSDTDADKLLDHLSEIRKSP
jgi:DNA-binding LytR/AlgR family response regulator